ncbi:GNAT family N-acetyltransferase [Stappia sp. F7233]|uniref:GNAT family N-acetyltransferase n=1 Tax=Stappia albiluteola TaxID=2758565 RepID=A0A839AI25_9HYPH|nr:GNAT family N-acetyltransferase [Stappia albiluteola]MBA5778572.1 GNAT family N-acetyltransferase [Stappia albiluteola]
MSLDHSRFRPATKEDADLLAELVNYAGEGLPYYLWSRMAGPGETVWEIGAQRALREDGAFSYRNATLIEADGEAAGCLIGYVIADRPEAIDPDTPPIVMPLQELESLAPGTWYVNVLAVLPEYRDRGLGTALMELADEAGRRAGKKGMSVIVSDANAGARRLYERCGYKEAARRPMVKDDWDGAGTEWVLLTKQLK